MRKARLAPDSKFPFTRPHVYQSLEAELHDLFWEAEGPAAELPLLRAFLKKHPGPALELGCGSGRLLLPLLSEGFQISGLDNAPEMIALCEESAQAQNLSPILHCGSLHSLPLEPSYQSIIIPAFTLQLLPDPIGAMQRVSQLLAPGGGLYFSVFYPWAEVEKELPENEYYPDHSQPLPDGKTASLRTKHQIDRQAQILTRTHHYQILAGETIEREHRSTQVIRYCDDSDWGHLIAANGLELQASYYDFEPLPNQELQSEDETAGVTTFYAIKEA